jgi:hypothetical protein
MLTEPLSRHDHDISIANVAHCNEHEILTESRTSPFWPHGGHLFCLHLAVALHLGGAEVNKLCFRPFGGYGDDAIMGVATRPQIPGIGFEAKQGLRDLLAALLDM